MRSKSRQPWRVVCTLALALAFPQAHAESDWALTGHFKYRFTGSHNPPDSLFRETAGTSSIDNGGDLRLNVTWGRGEWDARADYQLIAAKGDRVEFGMDHPGAFAAAGRGVPNDKQRLFDLTHVFKETDDAYALQRLDRLWLGRTSEATTVRFGRQAITWGNGLIYTPMDIFNPFDPVAVDKEYKPGDDMLYGQQLLEKGDDVQGVMVFRRNVRTGKVAADKSALAFKYHGFAGEGEFDALAAQNFGDTIAAFGGNHPWGEAIWRADGVLTWADDDLVLQAVTNLTYSWTWMGRNVSGIVEYFYNGFGQKGGDYSRAALEANPALLERLARGELFTLSRHYLAASATVEVTPLLLATPTAFVNLSDGSALLQLVVQDDLHQDLVLLAALNLPVGPDNTEYGGIETDQPGVYLSSGPGIFLQIAAYF